MAKRKACGSSVSDEKVQCNLLKTILESGGVTWTNFIANYFEKKPLVLRQCHQPDGFSKTQLLDIVDKNAIDISQMTICKYKDNKRQNLELEESCSILSKPVVEKCFADAYSVQFYQPQRYSDRFFAINSSFEQNFGSLAGASAYLTPPGAQALAPHCDDVEVFVFQTEGKKKWKVYQPTTVLPSEPSGDLEADELSEPLLELELSAGDLLYFPRGFIHQAVADDKEFSTHVTVSVYQFNTWANFMEVAIPRLLRNAFENDVEFRRGLPVNYLGFMGSQYGTTQNNEIATTAFKQTFQTLMNNLAQSIDIDELHSVADEAAMDFFTNRLPPFTQALPKQINEVSRDIEFRVVNPSHIRVMIDHENADGCPSVRLIHSCKNDRQCHMGRGGVQHGEDDEDIDDDEEVENEEMIEEEEGSNTIDMPFESLNVLLYLLNHFPKFSTADALIQATKADANLVRSVLAILSGKSMLDTN